MYKRQAQEALDAEGLSHIHICPETMGKINQLGDFDEVLTFCSVDDRFLPCVDFGHLNSRTMGPVSYTHLDVYKRQTYPRISGGRLSCPWSAVCSRTGKY